jgi:hypothetical protein
MSVSENTTRGSLRGSLTRIIVGAHALIAKIVATTFILFACLVWLLKHLLATWKIMAMQKALQNISIRKHFRKYYFRKADHLIV